MQPDFKYVKINDKKGKVLSGASPDDYNEIGAENRVIPTDCIFNVKDRSVELPPHSLCVLRF
ncbi:MAG: hypothetical protein IKK92_10240 [Prevotella sp.]|nr:hypothetical protein [Prevotella sp.]MBR6606224.1 hypothetical protein [Prevotella sp.]